MQKESFLYRAIVRFFRDPYGVFGLIVVLFLIACALLAPVLANSRPIAMKYDGSWYFPAVREMLFLDDVLGEYEFYRDTEPMMFFIENESAITTYIEPPIPWAPNDMAYDRVLHPPDGLNKFGTDELGRDILSRMLHGAGTALRVGVIATSIALFIGVILGSLAGYFGGWIDITVMRLIEVFMCFPTIFLLLTIVAIFPPTEFNIMAAIGLTGWTRYARLIRAEFFRLRDLEFTTAARALGAKDTRIIFSHILPNGMTPIIVIASFNIASAILSEATLSFLGLGIRPPEPTWGNILSKAKDFIDVAWWMAFYPGTAIFIAVLGYNLLGEGLRDALDPKITD